MLGLKHTFCFVISTFFKQVQDLVEVFQELTQTRSTTPKAMLVSVEQVVFVHEFHYMPSQNLLKELDQV